MDVSGQLNIPAALPLVSIG